MTTEIPSKAIDSLPSFLVKGPGGPYRISAQALEHFNAENGTSLTVEDMNGPDGKNVAGWLLDRIATAYGTSGLAIDWTSRDFVALVALGYLAGWADPNGVLGVVNGLTVKDGKLPFSTFREKAQGRKYIGDKERQGRAWAYAASVVGPGPESNEEARLPVHTVTAFSPKKPSNNFRQMFYGIGAAILSWHLWTTYKDSKKRSRF
jgi:hypothetical protein